MIAITPQSFRFIDLEQGTPAWLSWRNGGLGGSDAGAIWAEHIGKPEQWPYCTAEDIYVEKTVGGPREQTFAMRRGSRLEPIARDLFTAKTGIPAKPVCVEHVDQPWLRASLDGWHWGKAKTVLEIKAPNINDHDWACEGLVPPKYRPQLGHECLVTGADRVLYCSYSEHSKCPEAKKLAIVGFTPAADFLGELLEALEKFWARVSNWWAERAAA